MIVYSLKRLGLAVIVAFTVSVISFGLLHLSGDLAQSLAGPSATSADIQAIRASYGLDRPIAVQYLDWAGKAVRGDLGESFFYRQPVVGMITSRLMVTMTLGFIALIFALAVAIPIGVLAALWTNSWVDRLALMVSIFGQAMPSFWFALLLILWFGVYLGWLPISGSDTWQNFILPAVALGYYALPAFMRLMRAETIEVMRSDYIRTARSKGLRPYAVVIKHALRNALIPVVAVIPVQLGFMLGGSVVIESVFALNGLGFLGWQSISRSDFPVVQAIVLILAVIYVVLTLLADLLNAFLDPRVRTS